MKANKVSSFLTGTKILEERKSKFNGDVRVVRSWGMGTYIQSNGLTQSGGIVESIWRSVLKKIKAEKIKSVLVLGLGGGTVAKLIRKFWPEAKIKGVDIDPVMIELGKKYLGLDEIGIGVEIRDAFDLPLGHHDLIIVDLYQGDKFPKKFEDESFLKKLVGSGLVIFNRLYYGDKRPEAVRFGNKLQKVFKRVEWFYPEVNLMFVCTP